MIETRYIWEWPVRICHWLNVLSIIVLSVTGFYIGKPFVAVPDTSQYVMGWMRYIHFVGAYVFALSVLSRIIWLFLGNKYADWKMLFPWAHSGGRKNMMEMFTYYTFLSKKLPYAVGHNALAASAYLVIFSLFVAQILTGFALYGQFAPGGFWDSTVGTLNVMFGNQGLRLVHHMIMWLLIAFGIHHVYSAWLMDVKEKNGTMGSIFGGYKYIDTEHED